MKLKILIIGLGSIGKRQARLVQENFPHELFALRTYKGQEPADINIPEFRSWEEADRGRFDAAFITNPTSYHIQTAIECAERKIHLFLEKPIDCKLEGLDELIALVRKNRLTAYVAYPFRHHAVLNEMKKIVEGKKILHARMVCASYMPEWRSRQNHRQSYSSFKAQGGGAVLDLSHEIDMAAYLFGPIQKIDGKFDKVSDVTVDADDYADMIISHESSATNIHLNLFSRNAERYIEVDMPGSTVRADLRASLIMRFDSAGKTEVRQFKVERDDMFRAQLNYFFENLSNPALRNNLEDAAKTFRKIIEFKNERECLSGHLR